MEALQKFIALVLLLAVGAMAALISYGIDGSTFIGLYEEKCVALIATWCVAILIMSAINNKLIVNRI